jgi:hypothetical protein
MMMENNKKKEEWINNGRLKEWMDEKTIQGYP